MADEEAHAGQGSGQHGKPALLQAESSSGRNRHACCRVPWGKARAVASVRPVLPDSAAGITPRSTSSVARTTTPPVTTTIFDKKRNFIGVFLVTSVIGVLLISLAVYRSSRELEIIHEVDNMHRIIRSLLGEATLTGVLDLDASESSHNAVFGAGDTAYRFYAATGSGLRPLGGRDEREVRLLESIDLESTRVNERGGYVQIDGDIRTWTTLGGEDGRPRLLVVHTFMSTGTDMLVHVYRQRMIVPVFFYLWLMVWVSLILNHLVKRLKEQQHQMKEMATHDSLTGLPNRNLMEDSLVDMMQTSRREKKSFALALIDLDGFKGINDRYGHVYGDELLRHVARRLEGALRGSDTAARLGGDEFVVLLSDLDEYNGHAALAHILTALTDPYTLFDMHITIGASIGVSIYPVHGGDSDALLHHADQAMYAAKAAGGGVRLFEQESGALQRVEEGQPGRS